MSFNSRSEFIQAQASEKLVMARLRATGRVYEWTTHLGSIYKKVTTNFVSLLKESETELTKVANIGAIVAGSFYYDIPTSTLYMQSVGSVNPNTLNIIATYEFFYSNATISAPWDLQALSDSVLYNGRINSIPGYKHKVGIEQGLSSLTGQGDLVLENTDGGLDEIFDTLIFENQECFVYSWNRQLAITEAQIIYRGRVTNKSYDSRTVVFTIKDQIFDLDQKLPQNVYTDDDSVNDNVKGKVKRWVYGKVDGLKAQSIDQIGSGYSITGTVSGDTLSATLVGTGTSFLSELSPNDTLTISEEEFTVDSIASDTSLTLSDTPKFVFVNLPATVSPEIPTVNKNREFFITDHACSRITKTLVQMIQLNRAVLNNNTGLEVGDYVEFDTGERVAIKRLQGTDTIILNQNLVLNPTPGNSVIRQPVQSVYVEGRLVIPENYTLSNLGAPTNELKITLDDDVEFVLARAKDIGIDLTFTNGSRSVTTIEDVDLREILSPRDWIRPSSLSYTTYYEILSVDELAIELRVVFADPNYTGDTQAKLPDYISDDTVVSVNLYGRTVDGEPGSSLLKTGAEVVKDLCSEVGISNFNTQSFLDAAESSTQLISLAIPTQPGSTLTSAKDAIDLVNKSIYGALTLDNDLNIQYRILKNDVPSSIKIVRDSDVIDWKIKTTNGKNFRNSVINYKFQDYDRVTKEEGNSVIRYSSDFVRDYIGTNQTSTLDCYLYDSTAANIMSHRYVYFNRMGRSDITIKTDLRLEDVNIGDILQLEFRRLYKRFGDDESRKKLVIVVGLTKSGKDITIEATDLNNTFNTSAVITENTADPYASALPDDRLKNGYITDARGIVEDLEITANINLIS